MAGEQEQEASSGGTEATFRRLRRLLPGDERLGDSLSSPASAESSSLSRMIAEATAQRPGLMRDAGLTALQVFEALAGRSGGKAIERDVAIVFTDLVDFSRWALAVGDQAAVALLRDVADAIEPPVTRAHGTVVKRLGDGMMAVFDRPEQAMRAVLSARHRLAGVVTADDYRPRLRAAVHVGRPREVGGDYLGVDVNIAARIAEKARPGEILVSASAADGIDSDSMRLRRRWLARGKGVPRELRVYSLREIG